MNRGKSNMRIIFSFFVLIAMVACTPKEVDKGEIHYYRVETKQMYKMMNDGRAYAYSNDEVDNKDLGGFETKDLVDLVRMIVYENNKVVPDPNEYSVYIKITGKKFEYRHELSKKGKKEYKIDTRKIKLVLDHYADSIDEAEYLKVVGKTQVKMNGARVE